MTDHTPTPWSFDGDWYRIPTIFGADGKMVASIEKDARESTPERAANAALIIKAVNNHDALVARIEYLEATETNKILRLKRALEAVVRDINDYERAPLEEINLPTNKHKDLGAKMALEEITSEMQGCEHCGKEFPIDDDMTMMGDYWFCHGCYSEWKAVFDACEHHWTPEESEFGEPGQYCDKCHGFVEDAHMATVTNGDSHHG